MQKRLAILTVFLIVASAGFPSPRETANPETDPGANKAQHTQTQQPTSSNPTAAPQTAYGVTFNANTRKKTEKDEWDKAAVFSNCLLVVIGIFGIVAALGTLKKITKQTDLMEDTAKRQLRAYLCVEKACVKITEDGFLEGQLHVQNGGQTPAYDVMSWFNPVIREFPLIGPISAPPDLLIAKGIIPPQGHQIIVAKKIPWNGLVLGSGNMPTAFYVYGETCYKDIFGGVYTLEFRFLFGGGSEPRTTTDSNGVKIGFLHMDTEGNRERVGGLSFHPANPK